MKQKEIDKELFILLKKSENHQRELARLLKTNQTNVRRALISLEKENIIESKQVGKNKVYFTKESVESFIFEAITEYYKLFNILKKPLIRKIYKEIQEKISSGNINSDFVIVLFGSYTKDLEKRESDIDIYINSHSKEEKRAIQDISESINISAGNFDKDNLLFKEIKKNHIVLNNVSGWLNLVKKHEKTY